ncbi:MAG: T9SS type A sorting domain-containing protein [Chitinophagales bacterium]
MKQIITFIILFILVNSQTLFSQQYNSFEDPNQNLLINIDTANHSNIWQIGQPSKTLFSSAFSPPNALTTDTANTYPIDNQSSFSFKIDRSLLWAGFPYFILEWWQKMDCEKGVDGGIIEVSYDNQTTWYNIFEDPLHQPFMLSSIPVVSLFSGQKGISEQDNTWKRMGFCWSESSNIPADTIFLRFTFVSNSVDTQQEGWIIDNFHVYETIIDEIEDGTYFAQQITLHPNPTNNRFVLHLQNPKLQNLQLTITDIHGRTLQHTPLLQSSIEVDLSEQPNGIYLVQISDGKSWWTEKVVKY